MKEAGHETILRAGDASTAMVLASYPGLALRQLSNGSERTLWSSRRFFWSQMRAKKVFHMIFFRNIKPLGFNDFRCLGIPHPYASDHVIATANYTRKCSVNFPHGRAVCTRPFLLLLKGPGYEASACTNYPKRVSRAKKCTLYVSILYTAQQRHAS